MSIVNQCTFVFNISYRIPRHKGLLNKDWQSILSRTGVDVDFKTKLCSLHFEEKCFFEKTVKQNDKKRKYLHDGALPTKSLFIHKKRLEETVFFNLFILIKFYRSDRYE